MTNITHNFTYTLPNEPKSTDFSNNVTVNAQFTGPQFIWVVVDETTNKIAPFGAVLEDQFETFAAPIGFKLVKVDAKVNPVIATMLLGNCTEITDTVSEVSETLVDGSVYTYMWPQTIAGAFVQNETSYNSETDTWELAYYSEPDDFDAFKLERNRLLNESDSRIAPDMPDALKQKWIDYRQKLRDMTTVWANVPTWKIAFPKTPDEA